MYIYIDMYINKYIICTHILGLRVARARQHEAQRRPAGGRGLSYRNNI